MLTIKKRRGFQKLWLSRDRRSCEIGLFSLNRKPKMNRHGVFLGEGMVFWWTRYTWRLAGYGKIPLKPGQCVRCRIER
jgi:hypothetical protein